MNIVVKTKVNYLPAATHIDGTSRVQTVTEKSNPLYYKLLKEVGRLTGLPVVLNTSFNLKDQTITLTPAQAIQRFINSDIDVLVINNFLIFKR
jgi:carbamoyltransferase